MSYRNPTIVNDTSGSVVGQAIAQGAQTLAQGVVNMEKQNQVAIEKARLQKEKDKKEDEQFNTDMMNLSKTYNSDKQRAAALTKEKLAGIKDEFGTSMEENIDRGYILDQAFLKNRTKENREAVEKNRAERAALNEWMLNTGALVTNATEWAKQADSDIMINNSYPSIGTVGMKKDGKPDQGENAQELIKAFLNKDGYSYDYSDGNLVISRGDGKDPLTFTGTDLATITSLFDTRSETGVVSVQKGAESMFLLDGKIRDNMFLQDGEGIPDANGKAPAVPPTKQTINGKVYYRQPLDPEKVNGVVQQQVNDMSSMIDGMYYSQKKRYLSDFDITMEEWKTAGAVEGEEQDPVKIAEAQTALLKEKVEDVALQAINVKKEGDTYYRDELYGNVPKPTTNTPSGPVLTGNEYYSQANDSINAGLTPYTSETRTVEGYQGSVTTQLNKLFKFDQAGNGNSMDYYLGGKSKSDKSNFRDLKFKYEGGKLVLRAYTQSAADMEGDEDRNSKVVPIISAMKLVDLINVNNKTSMSHEQKGKLSKLIEEKLGPNFRTGAL